MIMRNTRTPSGVCESLSLIVSASHDNKYSSPVLSGRRCVIRARTPPQIATIGRPEGSAGRTPPMQMAREGRQHFGKTQGLSLAFVISPLFILDHHICERVAIHGA